MDWMVVSVLKGKFTYIIELVNRVSRVNVVVKFLHKQLSERRAYELLDMALTGGRLSDLELMNLMKGE